MKAKNKTLTKLYFQQQKIGKKIGVQRHPQRNLAKMRDDGLIKLLKQSHYCR